MRRAQLIGQIVALFAAAWLTSIPIAGAQLGATERADLLEASLRNAAQSAQSDYSKSAVVSFISSALCLGAAVWIAVDTDGAFDQPAPTLGVMFAAVSGSFSLVRGFALATGTSVEEQRLERWQATRRRGELDPITLARFEGELAAQAREDYGGRFWASNFGWIATAISAGVMLTLTAATADTTDERVVGYVLSGGFFALAGLDLLFAESDTFNQRVWREYVEAVEHPEKRKQLLEPPAKPIPPPVNRGSGRRTLQSAASDR